MRRFTLLMILLPLFLGGCGYNTLQIKEEHVFQAWYAIEEALQRRTSLIPSLVETVRAHTSQERETLQNIIERRSRTTSIDIAPGDLSDAQAMNRMQTAQDDLASALSRLLLVVERYPGLKENKNFADLQNQLKNTENRISITRQRYNQAVKEFNAAIRKFPYNMTNALLLNLERKEYLKATAEVREARQM